MAALPVKARIQAAHHVQTRLFTPPIGKGKQTGTAGPDLRAIFHAQSNLPGDGSVPGEDTGETDQLVVQFPQAGIAISIARVVALREEPILTFACAQIVV